MLQGSSLTIGSLLVFTLIGCGGKAEQGAANNGGGAATPTQAGGASFATNPAPSLGGSAVDGTAESASGGTGNPSGTASSVGAGGSFAGQSGRASSLPAACQAPIRNGDCVGASVDGWAYGYDTQAQHCERFLSSNCPANDNRFESLEDCIAACDPGGLDACSSAADCSLAAPGCCGACEPYTKEAFTAVNRKYASVSRCAQTVACGPCAPYAGTPTAQYFTAQCVQGHCQVSDSREAEARPCDPDARAAGNSQSAFTLAIAKAARPSAPMEIIILLPEVANVSGKSVDEWQAEIAAYQAPIVAALEARGATNIQQFSLLNSVSATLSAKDVPEVLCWPSVSLIETDTSYWNVVDRPWDLASVGSLECPLRDGQCPAHCLLMRAEPCDPALECLRASEPIACSINERGGIGGGCAANDKTGRLYCNVLDFIPREPWYLGWRDCTAAEEQRCGRAINHPCP